MRILIYTGKGGVGKTSISAATAYKLAKEGKKVLIMSTDQAHSLSDSFNIKLSYEPKTILENLDALEIDPVYESRKAWKNLHDYLKQIISGKANSAIEADEALLFPGLDELFSLLNILDYYEKNEHDVIIVDCAPTGETLSLLSYSEKLSVLSDKILPMVRNMNKALGSLISRKTSVPKPRDAVFEEFDYLIKRLSKLQEILHDREITSMRIVMTPEKIVLEEARRSYTWIQLYDFGVDSIFINKIYPQEALEGYFEGWKTTQEETINIAKESFPSQKIFKLQLFDQEITGEDLLEKVANQLYKDENPLEVFCDEQAFHIEEENGTRIFIVNLPFANPEDISIKKEESDLILSYRNETRRFHLPDNISRREMSGYKYEDGKLKIMMDY